MQVRNCFVFSLALALFLAGPIGAPIVAYGQEAAEDRPFKTEELDQMLAPIALYPDDLLSNVLVASTYPLEVVQAARWRKSAENAKLKGDALTKALESQDWDPSIKSLTLVPDVLQQMSDKLEWTQKLGDAFIAQEDEVFERIQFLRKKADEAGTLKTTKQQKVTKETEYIIIESAQPNVVYVPVYQPTVVYGTWWYPTYPPYYWYGGHPASSFVSGFFWGTGFAVANNLWGWGRCDWRRGNIDIDINRYNNINVNRTKITSNTWNHNPKHRGSVPYRDKKSREKFAKSGGSKDARKDFRGYDKDRSAASVKDKLGDRDGGKVKDKVGDRDVGKVKDKVGDRDGGKVKDKVGDRDAGKVKDKVGDRDVGKAKDKVGDRDVGKAKEKLGDGGAAKAKNKAAEVKPKAKPDVSAKKPAKKPQKPASKALDVKPKSQVKQQANRGGASRKAAASHPKAVKKGGGGGKRPGGGGGGRRR